MIVYHGSSVIIKNPDINLGKEDNDYGKGFYLTEDQNKANAWAVVNGNESAICNKYHLDLDNLKILYLDDYGVLTWIAEVIAHRGVIDENAVFAAEEIVKKYKIDTSNYDVIIGYRADDSYTKVIDSFLQGQLNTDEVTRFFKKGNLGQQVFIQSQTAFNSLTFCGYNEVEEINKYIGYDSLVRKEVEEFLNKRRRAIQIEGFKPNGITVQEAIRNNYVFNSKYSYYELKDPIIYKEEEER